jgi:hypothetical protein
VCVYVCACVRVRGVRLEESKRTAPPHAIKPPSPSSSSCTVIVTTTTPADARGSQLRSSGTHRLAAPRRTSSGHPELSQLWANQHGMWRSQLWLLPGSRRPPGQPQPPAGGRGGCLIFQRVWHLGGCVPHRSSKPVQHLWHCPRKPQRKPAVPQWDDAAAAAPDPGWKPPQLGKQPPARSARAAPPAQPPGSQVLPATSLQSCTG